MKVDININVNLDEIKEILTHADELQKFVVTSIEDLRNWVMDINEYGRDYGTPFAKEPEQEETAPEPDKDKSEAEPKAEISLEMVRAKLAALMQIGKQTEVKALLQKHGGEKLSDIPKDNYQALLEEAEAI